MNPTHVVVHSSASAYGDAALIDEWHKARDYASIGYHYVILNGRRVSSTQYDGEIDGIVELGRNENVTGAHAYGMNREAIGICLIGRDGIYTRNQMASIFGLILGTTHRHYIPTVQVIGHLETPHEQAKSINDRKTCPDLDMQHIRATLDRMRAPFDREIMAWGG